MNSREKDSKSKESWEKRQLKYFRRDSMQQKPNMCLEADGPGEFPLGELETVTDEVTSVHPARFELFSSFIFIVIQQSVMSQFVSLCWTHSCITRGRVKQEVHPKIKWSSFTQPYVVPV